MVQLFKLIQGLSHVPDVPILILSDPGLGKSATVYQLGEVLQKKVEMKSGNKMDPTDLNAIPYVVHPTLKEAREFADAVDHKNGEAEMHYAVPPFIKTLQENPGSILFFDEITTCPANIQAAMLSIIQDCKAGEFEIPRSTIRIAAGNYSNIIGTVRMSLALMNRFCIIHHKFDVDYFCEGLVSGFQNFEYSKLNPKESRKKKELDYRIMVSKFLKKYPDYGHCMPEDIINETDVSFPTPRTWEKLCQAMAVLDDNGDEFNKIIIDGLVGPEVGNLFRIFLSETERFNFDISSYVGRERELKLPHPNQHDEVNQIMSSLMFYFKDEPGKYLPLWKQMFNVLHNKDNKYGKYTGYDNFIMKYLMSSVQIMSRARILDAKEAKALAADVDDWNEMAGLSAGMLTQQ